jgi:ribosomal protein S27E
MALSPEMKTAWQQTLKTALCGSSEETLRLRCGTCGGPLHIVFSGGERASLTIRCTACSSAIALDAEREAPPWVRSLGPDITTGDTLS